MTVNHYARALRGVRANNQTAPKAAGAKRAAPEHKLQMTVKQYLVIALPASVEWTASAAGVRVGKTTAMKMKATGVRKGWPDLQFLFPDGVTRYIELKAGASLSPEQREFRERATPHGIWALCRTVDEVANVLAGWGAELKARPYSLTGAAT